MTIEAKIDYLQASADIAESDLSSRKIEKIAPTKFYKRGYQDANGTRYFYGNPNSKKAFVVMAGKALDNIRNEGFSEKDLLSSLLDRNGKFTRCDLAITQYDEPKICGLEDFQAWFKQGLIDSPLVARGGKLVSSLDLEGETYPETFYIGDLKKRGKKGLFRAYDKGAQIDIGRFLMIRWELEERGENSHQSVKRIAAGDSVASVFRSRFDVRSDDFQAVLNAEKASIERGLGKEKDDMLTEEERRWRWLIEQVAPSLKKAIDMEGELAGLSENVARFIIASGLRPEMMNAAERLARMKRLGDN